MENQLLTVIVMGTQDLMSRASALTCSQESYINPGRCSGCALQSLYPSYPDHPWIYLQHNSYLLSNILLSTNNNHLLQINSIPFLCIQGKTKILTWTIYQKWPCLVSTAWITSNLPARQTKSSTPMSLQIYGSQSSGIIHSPPRISRTSDSSTESSPTSPNHACSETSLSDQL